MQPIGGSVKAHGIDGAPCVAGMRCNNLHDTGPAEAFQRLCRRIGFTVLGGVKRLADFAPDPLRKGAHILARRSLPPDRLGLLAIHYTNIRIFVYSVKAR